MTFTGKARSPAMAANAFLSGRHSDGVVTAPGKICQDGATTSKQEFVNFVRKVPRAILDIMQAVR
jgi:hypothetical protein